jgi:hypothetical protein
MTTSFFPPRILAGDDEDCGGCNAGECVYPISSSNTLPTSSTLGDRPSCDCQGTFYVGQHCEIKCVKECLHGGKCVPSSEVDGGEETCSCTKAVVDGNPYAGLSCEYGATKSCMVMGSESKHSFCTNGECSGYVMDNEQHLDCVCDEGFEGAHCEYVAGTDPTNSTSTIAAAKGQVTNSKASANPLSPVVVYVFIGALIASICLIIAAFFIRAKRRANYHRKELELREATEELAMVDDDESDSNGEMGII